MAAAKAVPRYESPQVVTYQEDEILKQMGPVGGCVTPDYDPLGAAPRDRRNQGGRKRKYRSSLRASDLEGGIEQDEEDL